MASLASHRRSNNMVRLRCGVYGEGSVLSIDIELCAEVMDLQEAIARVLSSDQHTVAPTFLTLYLARKPGEDTWLKADRTLKAFLKSGPSTEYEEMIPAWRLDEDYFGEGFQSARRDIHVLVELPAAASAGGMQGAGTHEMLTEILASVQRNRDKSCSDAALGQMELERLEKTGLIFQVAPVDDGEAFWSEETQTQANSITNEAIFDAFITPFFSTILHSCGLVFVNSERYQWLPPSPFVTRITDLKPDGFATHRGMYRGKPAPNDGVLRPNGFRFGVAEEELFDCLILFESTLTITEAAFGRVVRYLHHLCPETTTSAILFDRGSFWMINSYQSNVVKVVKARWSNKGSKAVFLDFITRNLSPWVARLNLACLYLGVDVVEGDAFLGRGAYGRVFRVTRQDGKVCALKIVDKRSVGRLYAEEGALTSAQHTCLTTHPVGNVIETPESGALLLSPVGKPLPRPTTRGEVQRLYELLWQLHAHDLVHGDPRVPNVILDGEKPLWIDLVELRRATPLLKQVDAEILTRSILRVLPSRPLDAVFMQWIDNYGNSTTREHLDGLADVVCQYLRLP